VGASATSAMQRGAGTWEAVSGPARMHSVGSELIKCFSNRFEWIRLEEGLLMLESFQIKYGHVDNLIRNKFPHCSFSKFGMEFELKIRETI
jgi:hypothetical protein